MTSLTRKKQGYDEFAQIISYHIPSALTANSEYTSAAKTVQ